MCESAVGLCPVVPQSPTRSSWWSPSLNNPASVGCAEQTGARLTTLFPVSREPDSEVKGPGCSPSSTRQKTSPCKSRQPKAAPDPLLPGHRLTTLPVPGTHPAGTGKGSSQVASRPSTHFPWAPCHTGLRAPDTHLKFNFYDRNRNS